MDRKLKGLYEYQTEREIESQLSILRVLSYDEDRHRYSELKEKTELNDSTLSKQLDNLEKIKLIERNKDEESEEYPNPVYYRLNPVYANAFRADTRDEQTWEIIRENLWKKRNLLEILKEINNENNLVILGILVSIKENKKINDTIKRLLLELLLWNPYKSLTWNLIKEAKHVFGIQDLKEFVMEV